MYTPTSRGRNEPTDRGDNVPEDLTGLDSLESPYPVLFDSTNTTATTTTAQKPSPCSVTTPSDKIFSSCCCMFEEIQSELRRVPGNSTCCDCGDKEPQWASVTLASLVCIRCAGMHRALGVKKSRIRSLQMDSWSRAQVLRMLMGGNKRLKYAFAEAGKTFDALDVPTRYNGAIANDYVAKLNARCPPATPITMTPRMPEYQESSPEPYLRQRLPPISMTLDSANSKISSDNQNDFRTVTPMHRAYCPCSSTQRWTHLPTIAGEPKNMPILCSGDTTRDQDKNCIVSSFDKFRKALLGMCGASVSSS